MASQQAARVIKHGILALIVALVGGFALIFSMIQGISLSPLPVFIDVIIPGSPEGWRILHVGMLMNGIMAVALGLVLDRLSVTVRGEAIAGWGIILAVWGNFLFYLFGMFAPNHGVTMGDNALGEGTLAGAIAFFPALLGAVSLISALVVMFRAHFSRT
mgnify:CR=1 FL=1|jgi:hypothetical protein